MPSFLQIPRKRKIFNWTYSKSLFPVIVYVHGGHFLYGASDEYRPDYFMDEDVVVVTLNYRLNSFGKY
jgi:carboxylesterase type B